MGESILSWNVVTGSGQCMLAFQWYFVCLYFIFLCFSSSVLSFYICYIYILKCCHREWPVYAGHPVVGKLCWLFGFPFLHCPWRAKILFPTMMSCVFCTFVFLQDPSRAIIKGLQSGSVYFSIFCIYIFSYFVFTYFVVLYFCIVLF